jgi:hypothetical protein
MTGFLQSLPNYVRDAYRLQPSTPFVPENIVIGQYTFLPWVRGGVGAVVDDAAGGLRASLQIAVPVQAPGVPDLLATTTVQVLGPGDVLGIDERQIIRRYPMPESTNAQDTFLAHIEFDRPVLPWLFSPTAPVGDRLTPWLVLVVLAQGRYQTRGGSGGLPNQVSTFLSELQPTDDAWAWAHAQIVGGTDASQPPVDDRLTQAYGPTNLSRLMCPRKLAPDTQYLACVVPYYNAGVAAGLGNPAPASLAPAWTRAAEGSDADTPITLPVYTSWRFGVGADGDFGSLAAKLLGMPAPWQVGRRLTEMATPGGGLPPLAAADPGRLQTVHGPLVSPIKPDPNSQDPVEQAAVAAETAAWPASETEALRTLLNAPDELVGTTAPPGSGIPRPVVGPEIYDRYQAAASRLEPSRDGDWFGQLNLVPEHRVVGGLGVRVVQQEQEKLMESAWAQVGQIDAANRALRWAQLARFVSSASYVRHLTSLSFGALLAATRRVHTTVLDPSVPAGQPALTVAASVARSNLAEAALGSAFRRMTRPLGDLARFVEADPAGQANLVAQGDHARDMQRPYVELDGVNGVSQAAAWSVDPARVAAFLSVDPSAVASTLLDSGASLAASSSLIDIAVEQVCHAQNVTSYTQAAAEQLLTRIKSGLSNPGIAGGKQPAWSVASASLAISVQNITAQFGLKDVSAAAGELATRLLANVHVERPQPNQQVIDLFILSREAESAKLTEGFSLVVQDLVALDWPSTPVRPGIAVTPPALLASIDPAVTMTRRIRARLGAVLPSWLPPDWFDDQLLNPVMAAPVFTRPMYQALDAYSRDWLLPGLAKFSQPNLVTALISNAGFVEAFLGGLSHEMGRELLWRGYPTDQRGTYFRRFWDQTKDDLAQDLARFTPTPLGSHLVADLDGRVVLMVRGELIRRYPSAMVFAMYAGDRDADGVPIFEDPVVNPGRKVLAPIQFHGHLDPDVVLVGFDLTVPEITAAVDGKAGWWFVIAEHPTAPRFGLAQTSIAPGVSRDELGWDVLPQRLGYLASSPTRTVNDTDPAGPGQAVFGADAASIAHVLLRDPIRAAFEAVTLLTPTGAIR